MSNQNQKATEQKAVEQKEQPVVQLVEQPVQQVKEQEEQPKKDGIGAWLKRHWKGVTASAVGIGTAITTSILAYKKGKAAGIMSVPVQQQEQEDYSLNPNE